jgi:hypothetical protein
MAVVFHEAFVGGFFGFRRTYGAVARVETDSAATLKRDWLEALDRVRQWRESRGAKATSISFYFVVPEPIADETRSFIGDVLIAPRETPKELVGIAVDAVVFDPDGGVHFDSTIRQS